ncbi:unnamed protein product [Brassica oleracea]|uniref:Nudix hydrolase domain-containing protein n=1 Tax=Brassica oleracea TaxID=3712 RepID=A0A3P6AR15_BRAOL|nr:unnamed protein product [Brassica oleracea]
MKTRFFFVSLTFNLHTVYARAIPIFRIFGESAGEVAMRETWEEAGATVEAISPFAQLVIPLFGQTYVIFSARLENLDFAPGPESLECRLFALDEISFDSLAFSSIYHHSQELEARNHGSTPSRAGGDAGELHKPRARDIYIEERR